MDEVSIYIKLIRERIIDIVPEDSLDDVMSQITSVILNNFVNDGNYKLRMTQVIALVREFVGGYSNN
jgi:hypothetical protein